jgi:hypothetical protein
VSGFAIPLNRKWFLIKRTIQINTTAGSVNKGETHSSENWWGDMGSVRLKSRLQAHNLENGA